MHFTITHRQRLLFYLFFLLSTSILGNPLDSIGIERINGKVYVIHEVDKGETLYSISRRYDVSMNEIAEATPEVRRGLKAGARIRIPYKQPVAAISESVIHTVVKGETLFAISRKYGVTYQQIMAWNNLDSPSINIGQKLTIGGDTVEEPKPVNYYAEGKTIHVVQKGEGLYGIGRKYGVSVEELLEWNGLENSNLSIGQELVVKFGKSEVKDGVVRPQLTKKAAAPRVRTYDFEKISENGLAAMIEGTGNSKMYMALHRTAPVGTLIAVRNEMNDQIVFVRVVGKLPDTGVNDRVIIRISESAYHNIGAIDPKFRVELTYLPEKGI